MQDEIKIFKKMYGHSTTWGRSLATERVTTTTGRLCYVVNSPNSGGWNNTKQSIKALRNPDDSLGGLALGIRNPKNQIFL